MFKLRSLEMGTARVGSVHKRIRARRLGPSGTKTRCEPSASAMRAPIVPTPEAWAPLIIASASISSTSSTAAAAVRPRGPPSRAIACEVPGSAAVPAGHRVVHRIGIRTRGARWCRRLRLRRRCDCARGRERDHLRGRVGLLRWRLCSHGSARRHATIGSAERDLWLRRSRRRRHCH